MAFPSIASTEFAAELADVTSHDVSIPSGNVSTDLLILFMTLDENPTISNMPAGWVQLIRQSHANVTTEIWYKIGTQTAFAYTSSTGQRSTNYILRVVDWHGTQVPEAAGGNAQTATPDPPSLTASWGAEDNLWVAYYGRDNRTNDNGLATAYPTDYTSNQDTRNAGSSVDTCAMGIASRALNTATQDPGSFSAHGGSEYSNQLTLVVRPAAAGAQTISPSAIASAEAVGSSKLRLYSFPSAIASAEAHGASRVNQAIAASAIAPAEQHGSTKLALNIHGSGISTVEAVGTHKLALAITAQGVASVEAFGTPAIQLSGVISASGIPSGEAVGALKVNRNIQSVGGIASAEVFGAAKANFTLKPTGTASAEAFGTAQLNQKIQSQAIGSLEAFGVLRIISFIAPSGIVTAEAFGVDVIRLSIILFAIGSAEAFGTATLVGAGAVVPSLPGLEYSSSIDRLHFHSLVDRLHFSSWIDRLHYDSTEDE